MWNSLNSGKHLGKDILICEGRDQETREAAAIFTLGQRRRCELTLGQYLVFSVTLPENMRR